MYAANFTFHESQYWFSTVNLSLFYSATKILCVTVTTWQTKIDPVYWLYTWLLLPLCDQRLLGLFTTVNCEKHNLDCPVLQLSCHNCRSTIRHTCRSSLIAYGALKYNDRDICLVIRMCDRQSVWFHVWPTICIYKTSLINTLNSEWASIMCNRLALTRPYLDKLGNLGQ